MLNSIGKNTTNYHRFQYHPRSYDEKKNAFNQKRNSLGQEIKAGEYDVIKKYEERKAKKVFRTDLVVIGASFFICLLFSPFINSFFTNNYQYGQFGIYFLLILLGLVFTKRSRK